MTDKSSVGSYVVAVSYQTVWAEIGRVIDALGVDTHPGSRCAPAST